MKYRVFHGDCIESLKSLDDESVNCCVTSPPYWGLRDYGTATWIGGDPSCSHKRDSKFSESCSTGQRNLEGAIGDGIYKTKCPRCGAIRKDSQLGLEETPEEYVANMVKVFSEVKRVLTKDGTLWLNLGDSYAAQRGGTHQPAESLAGGKGGRTESGDRVNRDRHDGYNPSRNANKIGLKHKDLVGIPWRVAFALQADGWYLRQDIIWHKPNPMPESVTDRCTKAHEYIFLLSKSSKYYYDHDAIKEKAKTLPQARDKNAEGYVNGMGEDGMANKRSVWTVNTKPYKEAHFATFPKKLIRPCIQAGCPKGGVVLDPFGGSGTTAEVANGLSRDAILCELNPEYCELIEKRLSLTQMEMFA